MTGIDEMDRLATMFAAQRKLQHRYNGYDIDDQTTEQRIANYKTSHLALIDELFEAIHEMGWKEWATSRHFNSEAVKGELIDAWHFMMNLMMHAGMTPDDLYMGYLEKNHINHERQDQGYDGVSTKCPACKRAYDDKTTACLPQIGDAEAFTAPWFCGSIKSHVNRHGEPITYNTSSGGWVLVEAA